MMQMKLVISGWWLCKKSHMQKLQETECLVQGKKVAVSTITEPRPYQNEVKLAYPNKRKQFLNPNPSAKKVINLL